MFSASASGRALQLAAFSRAILSHSGTSGSNSASLALRRETYFPTGVRGVNSARAESLKSRERCAIFIADRVDIGFRVKTSPDIEGGTKTEEKNGVVPYVVGI